MERTAEEIMELYNQYEKLVYSTVYKYYSNPSFMISHGLEKNDLFQYGRIGLLAACKTYKSSCGAAFATHAIRNIVWSINRESKIDSLNNVNRSSNELVNKTSMDEVTNDSFDEESNLHDTIESEEMGYSEIELESFLVSVEMKVSKNVADILKMRLQGYSFEEIGQKMDASRQSVRQNLRRNREKIVKLYK